MTTSSLRAPVVARSYPPEFRCKVIDLVASGAKVTKVAQPLGINGQIFYD
ncbi:hypothetical protein ACPCVO_36075 [Streptomyces umbrinus]